MFGTTQEEQAVEALTDLIMVQYGFVHPESLDQRMRQQRIILAELQRRVEMDPMDLVVAMARAYARRYPN